MMLRLEVQPLRHRDETVAVGPPGRHSSKEISLGKVHDFHTPSMHAVTPDLRSCHVDEAKNVGCD